MREDEYTYSIVDDCGNLRSISENYDETFRRLEYLEFYFPFEEFTVFCDQTEKIIY